MAHIDTSLLQLFQWRREQQRTMTPASPLSLKKFVLSPASPALALKLVNLVSQCMSLVLFELLFPTL